MRQGQKLTRPGVPRLAPTGTPSSSRPRPFAAMVDDQPAFAAAFQRRLRETRDADGEGLNLCAWEFLARHPQQRPVGFSGTVAFQVTVAGGKGRIDAMKAIDGGDREFVDCFAGASSWASGEIEAEGPDFTGVFEWPYSFGPLLPGPGSG
jgi:hypothetical protein